jgi:hypothetical protein
MSTVTEGIGQFKPAGNKPVQAADTAGTQR